MKRTELALFAERVVNGTSWLPKPLRNPDIRTAKKPLKKAA